MGANATGKTTWDCLAMSRTDYLSAKIIAAIAVVGPVSFGVGAPVFDTATHAPPLMSYPTKVASGIELPRGRSPTATPQRLLSCDLRTPRSLSDSFRRSRDCSCQP